MRGKRATLKYCNKQFTLKKYKVNIPMHKADKKYILCVKFWELPFNQIIMRHFIYKTSSC